MGNRDALAEARRAELFASEQAVEHDRTRDLCVVFEKLADLLEEPLLARGLEVEQDVRFRKQLRDLVHAGAHTSGASPQKTTGGPSQNPRPAGAMMPQRGRIIRYFGGFLRSATGAAARLTGT